MEGYYVVYHKLVLHIHPSIPSDSKVLMEEFKEGTVLFDALVSVLSKNQKIAKVLLLNNAIRHGFLFISDKIELRSTNKLKDTIKKDVEIKIVPISHGG